MTSPSAGGVTRLLAAAALAAALVGCSAEGDPISLPSPTSEASSPTPSVEPSPSPPPSPSDPFAVPDEITADYVELVLNEINRLDAELTKDVLERPVEEDATDLPDTTQEQLEAIYAEPILTFNTRGTLALLRSAEEREDLVPVDEYGQLQMTVEEILAGEPCIIARVDRDYSEVDAELDTKTSDLAFVFLTQTPGENPTGWQLASLLGSDATPDSEDEEELRSLTADDLLEQAPETCS